MITCTRAIAAWAMVAVLMAGMTLATADDPPKKPEVALTIKTDRKRYDADDTVMISAMFEVNVRAKIQFSAAGNGATYFYLILQSLDGDGLRKGPVTCWPAWEAQFVQKQFVEHRPKARLLDVSSELTHQLAIHLPRLRGLAEGQYTLRIGYALHGGKLLPLVKAATGQDPTVDEIGGGVLEGAFEDALLSEPVTITIGPEKKK